MQLWGKRMDHDPEELLSLWFGDALASADAARRRTTTWFQSDPAFDEQLRDHFGDWPDLAGEGRFDVWRDAPRSCLALVMALDQLPRNFYRDSARAFAHDAKARDVADEAIAQGLDGDLDPLEAVFLYMPLEHSEDLADQERSVVLFECLKARAGPALSEIFEGYADYAKEHRDVIVRFSRFPHRNAALGRKDKRAELSFLAAGGARFGSLHARWTRR